jgi:hypothetical protein
MDDAQPLQLLSSVETAPSGHLGTFHLFPQLPHEIRAEIWQLPLRCERLIPILFWTKHSGNAEEMVNSIIVDRRRLISKIFHINQESRDVAMKFYRAHIPCYYLRTNFVRSVSHDDLVHDEHCKFLYINPEPDTLQLVFSNDGHIFARFLADIKAADPRHVGLRNLACDYHTITNLKDYDLAGLNPGIRKVFTETIAKLEKVYFVFDGADLCHDHLHESQRSRPVGASIPTFVRVGLDPRNIQKRLRGFEWGSGSPGVAISIWQ